MQQQPCAVPLTVTLRDADDQAVAGASVALRGATTQTATTDAAGQTQLCASAAGPVRVVVAGQLASGAPLRQIGQDADGVRFSLSAGAANRLDLRAEEGGSVLPDPATMWVQEQHGPAVTTVAPLPSPQSEPAEPLATAAPLILSAPEAPVATRAMVAPRPLPGAPEPAAVAEPSPLLVAALLVALLALVTVALLRRRARRAQV